MSWITDFGSNIADAAVSLKELRDALTFNGSTFSAGDPNQKSDEELSRRQKMVNVVKGLVKPKSVTKDFLKKEFAGGDQIRNIEDNTLVTPSDKFLNGIKEYRLGKYIAPVLNVVFSPTFAKGIAVVSAIAMLASPLGPAVGAIGMAISLGAITYDVVSQIREHRSLNNMREERVLLEEIKKARDEVNQLKAKAQGVDFQTIERQTPNLVGILFQGARGEYQDKKQSKLEAVGLTALKSSPTTAFTITSAVLTANPVSLGLAIFSKIAGYSASAKEEYEYGKRTTELRNTNNNLKNELGIEIGKKNGRDNETLAAQLNELRTYREALKTSVSAVSPTTQSVFDQLAKERDLKVEPSVREKTSVFQDFKTLFIKGLRWSEANRLATPSLVHADVQYAHGEAAFQRRHAKIERVEELHKSRGKTQDLAIEKAQVTEASVKHELPKNSSPSIPSKPEHSFASEVGRNSTSPEDIRAEVTDKGKSASFRSIR